MRASNQRNSILGTNTEIFGTLSSTGALTVAGGVGIGGDLTVAGDVGVGGALDVGYQGDGVSALTFARSDGPTFGSISGTGTTFNSILRISNPSNDNGRIDFDSGFNGVYFSFGYSGSSTSSDFSITDTTESTSASTGALVVDGGVGVGGALNVVDSSTMNNGRLRFVNADGYNFIQSGSSSFSSSSASFRFGPTYSTSYWLTVSPEQTHINPTTESTSVSTGALRVSGGAGIAGNLNVGGTVTIADYVTISSLSSSISTTTGALRVAGGVGIAGRLNIGDDTVAGNIRPSATETFDLGSASFEWNNIYAQNAVTVSDRTKKTDIEPCKISVEFLSKLNPVSYNYRSNGNPGIGLIAQDLYTVAEEYALEDYFVNHNNFKDYGIKYNALIPILINAIKELTVRIEKLEA